MAPTPLSTTALPPEHELKAFARLAGRLVGVDAARPGPRETRRRRAGRGQQFLGHREYRPGDDLRWVSWSQTARLGRPIVREYQAESSLDWLLCVDGSSSMAVAGLAKWHQATRLAAALGYLLLDAGHRVGLAVFASGLERITLPGRGPAQYLRLAAALTAHVPAPAGARSRLGSCARYLPDRGAAVVLSDFLAGDAMHADLLRLAAACEPLHALAISTAAERRLPAGGPFEVVDVESGERRRVPGGAATERAADRAARGIADELARFSRRAGIVYGAADAGSPWQTVLLAHLRGGRGR